MDALTKYYQAKEREESAVLYINDSFLETMSSLEKLEAEYEHMRLKDMTIIGELEEENAKLRALCRDMYLVVELLDMDRVRLQAHGKDADWRTLKERYDELDAEVTE